ncbi:SipW-dependent-type signal peptide-containing protein [Candidatus Woesebacteria bacterium]|nr:SipW-dependent-type signal peptide-containing protein [Candidatus Woesebacteria bacterium]
MNKKILLTIVAIGGLVTIGGVAVTSALFTDTETSGTNTFTAGTLNMTVGGTDGSAFENFTLTNLGEDGQVTGGKTWTIVNNGSIPGELTLSMNDLVNDDNNCNEPEAIVDNTCGAGEGELGANMTASILLDTDTTDGTPGVQVVSTDLATSNIGEYASQWVTNAGTVVIPPNGGQVNVTMNWATDPAAYTNVIQSDSLAFGLQFDLVQVVPTN